MLTDHHRIAILTDGHSTPFLAKTAISLIRYRPSDVVAVIDREHAGTTSQSLFGCGDVPVVDRITSDMACDAIYIGIAPPGGNLPPAWRSILTEAIQNGIDVVSGLHDFLNDDPDLAQLTRFTTSRLIDVRHNRWKKTATGEPFVPGNLRIHTVGHDCSVGKMVTTLEMQRGLEAAGQSARFLATGQTGIMISGTGVPADCVVADFLNGAVEYLVREHQDQDYLLIEGQGSIAHPAFSAVTAGLLHGCAPHGLVFCYEAGRTKVKGFVDQPIVSHEIQMQTLLQMAQLRQPARFLGLSINTRNLSEEEAQDEIARAEDQFQLPACDVYRQGAEKLVQAAMALKQESISV